ncbi:MAG: hypothetical protein II992_05595 [Lachnospiraceae bacterium]|nr:hypothetical protein [Lachnospiraceae bacterium]
MSAIYGIYSEEQETFCIQPMEEALNEYKIEQFANIKFDTGAFGCGLQFFTKESHNEILPYADVNTKIYMTADVVLDNREELIAKLGIKDKMCPDGAMLYQAYLRWGEDCVHHLRGVYSFALYDGNKKTFYLFTDHTGSRTVYYYQNSGKICFGTTMSSVLSVVEKTEFDEKWITICEAASTPDMCLYPDLTPYKNIYQLEAGHYLKVSTVGLEKIRYWNPLKQFKAPIKFEDEKCKQLFLKAFQRCVKDLLRDDVEIGAMVSSGLDSTSVVSIAASYLSEKGKKLFAYTSIPEEDFKMEDLQYIVDESWGQRELKKQYKNIQECLLSCPNMDGFTKLNKLVPLLEIPVKSAPNVMWIDEIYKKAKADGCRILLKGQYGNGTISYGKILTLLHHYISKGRFFKAYKQMNMFGSRNAVPRKKIIKAYFSIWKEKNAKVDFMSESFVKKDLLEKYRVNDTVFRLTKQFGGGMLDTQKQRKNFLLDMTNLAQLAAYDTKFSLIHGVLVRDPTKDKRMIELCLQLPMECFVYDGVERRLVRQYMKGIVPDSILNVVKQRGMQSADYGSRIEKHWDTVRTMVVDGLKKKQLYRYLDKKKLDSFLELLQREDFLETANRKEIYANAMNLYAFSVFLCND